METKNKYLPKNNITLDIISEVEAQTWAIFQQITPTTWKTFKINPKIIAIELLVKYTPTFKTSTAILIGSPNAWILDEGFFMSSENTPHTDNLGEYLWRIGREAAFNNIGPWIEKQKLDQIPYLSFIIFPNIICVRDASILEKIAEKTWTDKLHKATRLKTKIFTFPKTEHEEKRIKAQIKHLQKIYKTDLGIPIKISQNNKTQNNTTEINQPSPKH